MYIIHILNILTITLSNYSSRSGQEASTEACPTATCSPVESSLSWLGLQAADQEGVRCELQAPGLREVSSPELTAMRPSLGSMKEMMNRMPATLRTTSGSLESA